MKITTSIQTKSEPFYRKITDQNSQECSHSSDNKGEFVQLKIVMYLPILYTGLDIFVDSFHPTKFTRQDISFFYPAKTCPSKFST